MLPEILDILHQQKTKPYNLNKYARDWINRALKHKNN